MSPADTLAQTLAAYAWPPATRNPAGTAHAVARVPANWSPSLSPDAAHVVFISDRADSPRAFVQTVGGEEQLQLATGTEPVVHVCWSPDGQWIACELAPGGGVRHEVWLIRPNGEDLHLAASAAAGCALLCDFAVTSGRLAITHAGQHDSHAWLIAPETGACDPRGSAQLLMLLDVSPDERCVLLRHGPRSARWLAIAEHAGGERPVLGGPGNGSSDLGCFSADGNTLYIRSDVDRELAALWAVCVRGAGQRVIAERADAELEGFVMSRDRHVLVLLWNVLGGRSEVTLLDLATERQRPLAAPPGEVFSGLSLSRDGSWLALTAEGPSQPRNIWLVNVCGETAVPLTYTPPQLNPKKTVAPELQRFAAADGVELSGWLYRASAPATNPGALVVYLHGGPEAQDRPTFSALYADLVARGISVFAANVRGSSGFGRMFVNADNRERRYAAIGDVRSCVDYLVSHELADPARIGCMGRSYGGYLTLAALVQFPELFAVGIDICGMADLQTFYERTEPWIAADAVSKYGHPEHDRDLLRDLSPLHRFDRLAAPLLVVHGAHDTNVPLYEAEQVVQALAARQLPGGFLLFPDEGHEILQQHNRTTYIRAIGDWLSQHLLHEVQTPP